MKKSTFSCILSAIAVLSLFISATWPETPETILIRRTLANDLSGYRRADADLVLSGYHEDFFTLQGNGNADPRGWSVLYENLDAFVADLGQKLAGNRYETERTLPFIYVRGKQAMITSLDSGQVVDRKGGDSIDIRVRRFWTLRKVEEEWLITSLVDNLGDSAVAVQPGGAKESEIVDLLQREEQAWENGSAGSITGLFDEQFIGYSGYGTIKPETWKIVFSNVEELEKWLDKRFQFTAYQLDREVIFTTVGADRRQALALTREQVRTTHEKGDVAHSMERYVLWTLSRRSGDWKITNMCYELGLAD